MMRSDKIKCLAIALTVLAGCIAAAPAGAQNYPDHPVKIVVPYPPGGPADTVARVTTAGLGAELGGTVVIENVPGAGGRRRPRRPAGQRPMATRSCSAARTSTRSRPRSTISTTIRSKN